MESSNSVFKFYMKMWVLGGIEGKCIDRKWNKMDRKFKKEMEKIVFFLGYCLEK